MKTKTLIFAFLLFLFHLNAYPNAIMQTKKYTGNNICTYFNNFGVFNQNFSTTNTPGLEWHCNNAETYVFTSGLSALVYIKGEFGMFSCSYKGELAPGYINDSVFITNSDFKIYKVSPHDSPWQNPDYANWYKMIPFGAPYEDVNNNCIFETGIDKPGVPGSEQTIFICMTDLDIDNHNIGEGFGGGIVNPLLFAEVRLTSWGYNISLPDIQYFRYEIINKGKYSWDSTYFSIYCDPDIMLNQSISGDFIGCDTSRNLGFAYSANTSHVYGAYGMRILRGPVNRTTGDTLYMTSFTHNRMLGSQCENISGNPFFAYNNAKGYKPDRTPYMNPVFTPPVRTKYIFSGDPELNTGWTPNKGYIFNCGGNDTGAFLPSVPGADRISLLNTGADNLRIFPNDTQRIYFAQLIAKGNSNPNSVTQVKRTADIADLVFKKDIEKELSHCPPVILPDDFTIAQNYPNPFNNSTIIQYTVPRSSYIKIAIYDLLGREIARPVNGQVPPGYHQVNFSSANLASGVYFYRMIVVDNSVSSAVKPGKIQKMVVIK
jgi:hypothetical protein